MLNKDYYHKRFVETGRSIFFYVDWKALGTVTLVACALVIIPFAKAVHPVQADKVVCQQLLKDFPTKQEAYDEAQRLLREYPEEYGFLDGHPKDGKACNSIIK